MKLTEDDVPEAKLEYVKIQPYSERWYACRCLFVSGNKNALVES